MLIVVSAGLVALAAPAAACPSDFYYTSYLHQSLPPVPEDAVAARVEILTSNRSGSRVEIVGRVISMLKGSYPGPRVKIAPSAITSCDAFPKVGQIGIVAGSVRSSSKDELTIDPIRTPTAGERMEQKWRADEKLKNK